MPALPYSLEFAFQLLGDVRGKTIVDLGCGDESNRARLASLGARVISVDVTETGRIPVEDFRAHGVLANSVLGHVDALSIARQIRRVLKPGGIAVFREPVTEPLTLEQVGAVSRAVGTPGRFQLGLSLRFIDLAGIRDWRIVRLAQRLDNWILDIPMIRRMATPLVWEARKEC